jgi:hypothetical protein
MHVDVRVKCLLFCPILKTHLFSPQTFLFVLKGPAADATDAPQPKGLLCNPVMKMIRFFSFLQVTEHR